MPDIEYDNFLKITLFKLDQGYRIDDQFGTSFRNTSRQRVAIRDVKCHIGISARGTHHIPATLVPFTHERLTDHSGRAKNQTPHYNSTT